MVWALIVAVVGTIAWFFAFAMYAEVGSDRNAMLVFPLSAVPFALVAGLLLRRWYFKVGAMALVVASGVGLLAVLAGTVPDELDELNARLAGANLVRGQVFITQIPGYHRVGYQGAMEPDDPLAVPLERYVSLHAYPDDPTGDCQPHPHDSTMAGFPCTVEQPGLTYSVGVVEHEYFYRKGTVLLRIVGSLAVDRNVLRDAILTARPTAEPDIYTTDIAGYEAAKQGPPLGMGFRPKDKTQVPFVKHLEVSASPVPTALSCAAFQNVGVQSGYLECVDERPGVRYQRMADKHLYVAQHGSLEVRVIGGLWVDRNLLRDAAVSARLATDDELITMLPPAPSPTRRTIMDRLKAIANDLLG